jgi:hypothetical protein
VAAAFQLETLGAQNDFTGAAGLLTILVAEIDRIQQTFGALCLTGVSSTS